VDSESEDLQLHVPDARTEVRTLGNKAHGMLREYGLGRRPDTGLSLREQFR